MVRLTIAHPSHYRTRLNVDLDGHGFGYSSKIAKQPAGRKGWLGMCSVLCIIFAFVTYQRVHSNGANTESNEESQIFHPCPSVEIRAKLCLNG